ncbi:hypothetical protein OCT51_10455 [Halomonas sp. LR3S48]|uniref:hypothetical protein n=1 Tax=Halomonas sp. LR3S48 TaxID=2982694 RepID=UPI0021E45829|nr:hypothetical protein [Halomonas sp. LR3S48]UYG05752.1 hypothetical protein OCT51_10455 [Halomonas sp. LR3S48]
MTIATYPYRHMALAKCDILAHAEIILTIWSTRSDPVERRPFVAWRPVSYHNVNKRQGDDRLHAQRAAMSE